MTDFTFNNKTVTWNQLEGIDHLNYFVLDIDPERQIVDVLLKFDANKQIVLHRHLALNHLLVLQGEHRLYEPDGSIKEVRPTGRYTVSQASDEPHREGGGDEDVVILFSIRGTDGRLYEFLDDDLNTVGEFTMDDFVAIHAAQQAA
jgi:hypothetical protein